MPSIAVVSEPCVWFILAIDNCFISHHGVMHCYRVIIWKTKYMYQSTLTRSFHVWFYFCRMYFLVLQEHCQKEGCLGYFSYTRAYWIATRACSSYCRILWGCQCCSKR